MAEQKHTPSDFERMSLDQIIEVVTADLESSAGHYVQFGVPSQQSTSHNWGDYNPNRVQRFMSGPTLPNSSNIQPVNPMPAPVYMHPEVPTYEPPIPDPIYFPPQTVNHLGINENNDLVGTIDVGGGNFINVIYGNASQIMAEQCQLNGLSSYSNQSIIDREYGLFGNQQMSVSPNLSTQNSNSKQLIDNLVGNWVPNQSGTYSPFGGSPNVTPVPQSTPEVKDSDELPRVLPDGQQKKPRMVAEVKPMRPSYSDVLAKSVPPPSSPQTAPPIKPKQEGSAKKIVSKKNKTKPAVLKRQNSSGSDDHNSPKVQAPKKILEKNNSNLPRRWVSLDNLGSPTDSELNSFDRSDHFEKKRPLKSSKKGEKNETLNNSKIQNGNTKPPGNVQKRPIQINNNLNTINSFSQTVSADKIEKNQQANNKVCKDEKKAAKDKGSKRFQSEKAQQIRKGQRSRKRENRESAVKDLYRSLNKHVIRWSKIALKIFYWLLHLISDVGSMSANLVVQL